MRQLKNFLGVWKYEGSTDKVFSVTPILINGSITEKYKITWGDSIENLGKNNRMHIVKAAEAFKRILAKERGGYVLVTPYVGKLPESADLSVDDLYPNPPENPAKASAKPPKKRFNFLDWIAERE